MTRTRPTRGTRAALTEVYADLAPDLDAVARRHARRYGADYEDARADANLHFVEAYHTHDPDQSDIGQRVVFVVAARLRDAAVLAAQRSARLARAPGVEPDACHTPPKPERYPLGALWGRLSPDGRSLVALALESPPELMAAIRADPHPGPDSVRRHLRRHLRTVWLWSADRADDAFQEVADAL